MLLDKNLCKNAVAALYFIILAVIALGANPFAGETSAPVDLLSMVSGWGSYISEKDIQHLERSDILDSMLPQWKECKTLLRQGDPALWNPYPIGGRIGIFDVSRSIFTPSFLIFSLFSADWLGFYFACLAKIVLAGFGFYLFIKRLQLSFLVALFGGTVYALCGFHSAWFYWQHVNTSIFIPWLFWALSLWQTGDRNHLFFLATVCCAIFLITGGFPAVTVYGFYAAGIWLAVELCLSANRRDAARKILFFILATGCAALIAAPVLFALLDFLRDADIMRYRQGGTCLSFPKDMQLLFSTDMFRVEKTFYLGPIAACFAALGMTALWRPGEGAMKTFAAASLLIFFCSAIVAFGLLPAEILRGIPLIGKNPWNRLVVLIDFAGSTLAAIGLAQCLAWSKRIASFHRQRAVWVLLFVFCLYQVVQQVGVFHKFNNVALKENFYPQTEVISLVRNNIQPFQSVVADRSYCMSGILGYYGLAEWFAADFISEGSKKTLWNIVEDPYQSAASASFVRSQINFDSPLIDRFGIRYFLIKQLSENEEVLRVHATANDSSSPPLPENAIQQSFTTQRDLFVSKILLKLASKKAELAEMQVRLRLYDQDMKPLATSVVAADAMNSRNYVTFNFDEDVRIPTGTHWLDVSLDGRPEKQLKLYVRDKSRGGGILRVNGQDNPGTLVVVYIAKPPQISDKKYRIFSNFKEPISVVENLNCPAGSYFVPSLSSDEWNETGVTTVRKKAHDLRLEYTGGKSGFLVLPMRYAPGWSAYVNGAPVQVSKYLDALPAIAVQGNAYVRYVYEPKYLTTGLFLTCAGLLMTFAACFGLTRQRAKR